MRGRVRRGPVVTVTVFSDTERGRCISVIGVDPEQSYRELLLDVQVGGPAYRRLQRSLGRLAAKKPLPLAPMERRLAALVVLCFTNAEAAQVLGLSEETVKSYMRVILAKTGCRNRTALAVWGVLQALRDDVFADTIEEMAA